MKSKETMTTSMEGLATMLVLQDQVKKLKNLKEFGFFTTNETHRLLHFNTAFLWQKWEMSHIHLLAQSEVGEVDEQTPVNDWIKEIIKTILTSSAGRKIQSFDFSSNAEASKKIEIGTTLLQAWPEILPRYLLWSPFLDLSEEISGGLILFRDHAFSEQEVRMYSWLASNYQYTWQFLTKGKLTVFRKLFKKRNAILFSSIILLGIMLFPVRLSVVSSATVSAKNPAYINSPITGIIKEFLVKPGDSVKENQVLVVLDKKDIQNSLEVNQKKSLLAEAKLRSANTQGYEKAETRSEIPILEADLAINKAEVEYNKSVLEKTDIKSPISGIAVFDSKEDWIGQPVQAGETILTVANPKDVELKISIPVADLIDIEVGSNGKFYIYGQFSEIPIRVTALGYSAKMMPNKTLAYTFEADFTDLNNIPRLGTQGTARVYGHYVPIVYYLFRRPIQYIRQMIGV